MAIECTKMPDSMPFRFLVQDRGNDFWVSSLAGVSKEEMPDRMASLRVEDELVSEVFTHCYFKISSKIKSDANAITDEFGLGLRKKRVTSHDVPGCVFVLVNKNEETLLSRRRAELSSSDRRLSPEERLRRTQMQFDVSSLDALMKEAKACKSNFWLTSYSEAGAEESKKRVVTMSVEGTLAPERFSKCILVEVPDCQKATEKIIGACGLGLRKSAVRSRGKKGSVALLFSEATSASSQGPRAATTTGEESYSSSDSSESSKSQRVGAKRAKPDGRVVPAQKPKKLKPVNVAPNQQAKREKAESSIILPITSEAAVRSVTAERKSDPNERTTDEELHYRQVQVLEKRLASLLPTLPRDQLSTPFLQAKLEQQMQKPAGRLDKFKLDIGRIWRAFADAHPNK